MKRRLWKLLLLFIGLPALLLAGAQWWFSSRFTTEEIVRRLTAAHNCQATAGSATVRLFSFPARVEVRDLKVTPFDESHKPATPGETWIHVDRVLLEVNLWSLITGELDIKNALIEGVDMHTVKWSSGGNSLRVLLAKPGSTAQQATQPATLEDSDEIPAAEDAGGGNDKPFHVSELPVTSTLREARIRNASWTIVNQRKHTVQQYKDCSFTLTGMTLDPSNPAAGGRANVSAGTRLVIDSQRLNIRTLDFILGLEGAYQIIDPVTGNLNEDLDFKVTVKKGSLINRLPTLVKLNERFEKLKASMGLDLNLPPQATLTTDTVINAGLKEGVIRLREDVYFPFDTYQLALDKDSWLSLRDDQHLFNGRIMANREISERAVAGLKDFLEKRGKGLASLVNKTVLEKLVNAENRIELPFQSSEAIGSPDVKLSERFMDILKRSGAEAGKDLIKDALEGGDDINNLIDSLKGLRKKEKPPESGN